MRVGKTRKGFTLFETIIYIAILGILAASLVGFVFNVQSLSSKNFAISEVTANSSFIMKTITRYVREADAVVTPSKQNSSSVLELDMPNTNDNIFIEVNGGAVEISQGVSTPIQISTSEVEITSLTFTNTSHGRSNDAVYIELDLSFRNAESIEFVYEQSLHTLVRTKK